MPGRGRPRTKTADERRREGTYREDRHAEGTFGAPPGRPPMPRRLSPTERRCWGTLVDSLELLGLVSAADVGVLEAATIAFARAVQFSSAARKLKAGERLRLVYGRHEPHGAIKAEREAWREFNGYARELGLSPAARRALGHTGPEKRDPLDELAEQLANMPVEVRE